MKEFPIDKSREVGRKRVNVPTHILNIYKRENFDHTNKGDIVEVKGEVKIGDYILEAGDKIRVLTDEDSL